MVDQEAQDYINGLAQTLEWPRPRYVPEFHKVMAGHDYPVLKAQNALGSAVYGESRLLDPETKELLFVLAFSVLRAGHEHMSAHIQMALDLGISSQKILETIEMALPIGGVMAFLVGFEAWREVTQAAGIEPTVALRQFDAEEVKA
jgi:4-carboxymuconolactone decarboxylase